MKIVPVPSADSSAFRSQRLRIAMLSNVGGKILSIALQLLAMPLAITVLGVDRFGIYAMMVVLLNWINFAGLAINPGLTVQILRASSTGTRDTESRVFTTAFLFALFAAGCLFIGLHLLFQTIGIAQLFGAAATQYQDEVNGGIQILLAIMSLSIVLSIVEGAQAGYQNQYVNNLLGALGSGSSVIVIFIVVKHFPTIPNLIMAIYGAPLVARVINMLHLFWHHSYLLPWRGQFSMAALRTMFATGSAFLMTLFGSFFYQNFSIYWAGHELGPAGAAQMSVMMLVITLSGSMLIIVTQPLWPAIQHAVLHDDLMWVQSAYQRVLRNLVPYTVLCALALALGGEYILNFWLNSGVTINLATRLLWGLYFFLIAWEHICHTILMGFNRFWFSSICYSIGALVMLITSVILCRLIGITGIFVGLCLGPLTLSVWLFPREIRRMLARH